jgi:xanthine dehydrogenase accessory factor
MAVNADGGISGSVSGGCVENAVVEAARQTIATGVPQRLRFGIADDTAWGVGLACGGAIEVFVERLPSDLFPALRDALRAERRAAVATVVAGTSDRLGRKAAAFEDGRIEGDAGSAATDAARAALAGGDSRRVQSGGEEIFVDVLAPSAKLIIVGGVHIAVSLVTLAKALGFRTILVDPREAFGNAGRFPHADQVVNAWPDRGLAEAGVHAGTAIAVLTHDPKLDDPAILGALRSRAFYVGALGSQRTQEKRRRRLLEAGATEAELARLHGPIGLPLGGRSPEEIAMSILAEVVAVRNGKRLS